MTNLVETWLPWMVSMVLSSWITSLWVSSTSRYPIMHLHSVLTRFFHVNRCVLARCLSSFTNWIHFSHLNNRAFRVGLSMQRAMTTSSHTLIFQIRISLWPVILIILFGTWLHRLITRLVLLVGDKRVHVIAYRMTNSLHMLFCTKLVIILIH